VPELARQIDVLPTVLELLGLPIPPGLAGRSLGPALRGQALGAVGALSELDLSGLRFDSWRTERWRLIRQAPDGAPRLYDLATDPGERNDLAAQHPDVTAALVAELERAKAAGRERASLFGATRALTLTPAIQDELAGLGYTGAEAPGQPENEAPGEDGGR